VRRAAAALLGLAICTGAAGARTLQRPDPLVQAQADGCVHDRAAIRSGEAPAWVYVGDASSAPTDPPPAPRWVSGVVSATPSTLATRPSTGDEAVSHDSYDAVVDTLPGPPYTDLLGLGNDSGPEAGRLALVRESATLPLFAWPGAGDRVQALGSWVWDCTRRPVGGERTELHPFRVLWVQRSFSPRSPTGESEGDLFVTTDGTPAAVIADCAHATRGDGAAFETCLSTGRRWQDVSGDYSFTLRAPRRPAGAGPLRVRIVDEGGGGPDPTVTLGASSATITLHLAVAPGQRLVVAKEVFLGWADPPPAALPEHLRVRFRSLLVRRAMDPDTPEETTLRGQVSHGPVGEWNLYWDVAGLWGMWSPRVLLVRDGQLVRGRQVVDVYVPRRAAWQVLTFTRECDAGSQAFSDPTKAPWPCPTQSEQASPAGDDVPGATVDSFRTPELGLGLHRSVPVRGASTCAASNPQGCYQLEYVVTRVG
jgi:hypothetical protein